METDSRGEVFWGGWGWVELSDTSDLNRFGIRDKHLNILECRPSLRKLELKIYLGGQGRNIWLYTCEENDKRVRKILERFIFPSET